MNKLLNANNGEVLYSQNLFKIKNISFKCVLCPNGLTKKHQGFVQFGLKLKKLSSNIEYVEIYYELKCETIPRFIKQMRRFHKRYDQGGGAMMKLKTCKDLNMINLNCFVKIHHIKYKDKETDKHDYKTVF